MTLPNLPAKLDKRTNQINRFLGINWTENYQPGEYTDTLGLSTDDYPCLSQRMGISESIGDNAPTDATSVFEWGEHIFLVDGTKLLMDGDEIATVEAGTKQFAVVNKWLVVLPDSIMVDLQEGTGAKPMSDPVEISTGVYLSKDMVTSSSVKATYLQGRVSGAQTVFALKYPTGTDISGVYGYFYGFDVDALEACYHDGAWDLERLEAIKKTYAMGYDPVALDAGEQIADYPCYFAGMLIIPDSTGKVVPADEAPVNYNTAGNYWYFEKRPPMQGSGSYISPKRATYKVSANTSLRQYADSTSTLLTTVTTSDKLTYEGNANDPNWAYLKVTQNGTDYIGYCLRDDLYLISDNALAMPSALDSRPYRIGGETPFADAYLHGGYKVSITGTQYGLYDKEDIVVASATPNKLTFADGTFNAFAPYYYEVAGAELAAGQYVFKADTNYFTVTLTERAVHEEIIFVRPDESDTIYVWNQYLKVVKAQYTATRATTGTEDYTMTLYDDLNPSAKMVVTKNIPELDYICESNNRLWGVSNYTDTIYASSLGDPTDWWTTGLDDGAYQLAVSSEGPFTGIIEYGNAVLAWKEDSVTKILGSYPSQYYTNEYQYPGVQNYAAGTMQIINGILYYKGVNGFYAFSSTPTLISSNLNGRNMYGCFGGSDGKKYYCSVYEGLINSEYCVLVYDIEKGLWIKELDWKVDGYGFFSPDHILYFISGGKMYWYDPTYNERVPWKAEFCPFIEGTTSNSVWTVLMGKKGYTKLILFVEMGEDAWMKFDIKEDNKPWKEIGVRHSTHPIVFRQPIRLGRCSRVQLRLTGKGKCMIRAINREYVAGSDK